MTDETAIAAAPSGWDLFQLLRTLEARHPTRPRLGRAKRAADEPIRAGQVPHFAFPTGTVASFAPGTAGRPARVQVFAPGLFGPMGPLPLHLTAYARHRQEHELDDTFKAFCDALQHRFILLFYRAWAEAHAQVGADRPGDRYGFRSGALGGVGEDRFGVDDTATRHAEQAAIGYLAGRGPRHPGGLAAVLEQLVHAPVRIEEFVPCRLALPPALQTRLDGRSRLGEAPVVGRATRGAQQRFRVVLGPLPLPAFLRLLPGGPWGRRVAHIVRLAVGPALEVELRLVLSGPEVPEPHLDGSLRLGLTSWLRWRPAADGGAPRATRIGDAADLRLDVERLLGAKPLDGGP